MAHHWRFPLETASAASGAGDAAVARRLLTENELALLTRLTVITGYAQLLEKIVDTGTDDPQRLAAYSAAIVTEAMCLEQLVRQSSAAARLQWDVSALDRQPVELDRLAQSVVSAFDAALPPRRGRELTVAAQSGAHGVWDAHWLGAALSAVVSNALRYSPDGSVVRLTVQRRNGDALVSVSDTGHGIAADETQAIFEPFRRGSAGWASGTDGWGLGLFIASRAVVAHGGWIEIESEPGRGSAFRLHVPLAPPDAPAGRLAA